MNTMNKLKLKKSIFTLIIALITILFLNTWSFGNNNSSKDFSSYLRLKEILSSLKQTIVFNNLNPVDVNAAKKEKKSLLSIIESAENYYLSNKMEIESGALKEYYLHVNWAIEHQKEIDSFYNKNESYGYEPKGIFIENLTKAIVNNKTDLKTLLQPYLSSINATADFTKL